jgi:hypothetical protein
MPSYNKTFRLGIFMRRLMFLLSAVLLSLGGYSYARSDSDQLPIKFATSFQILGHRLPVKVDVAIHPIIFRNSDAEVKSTVTLHLDKNNLSDLIASSVNEKLLPYRFQKFPVSLVFFSGSLLDVTITRINKIDFSVRDQSIIADISYEAVGTASGTQTASIEIKNSLYTSAAQQIYEFAPESLKLKVRLFTGTEIRSSTIDRTVAKDVADILMKFARKADLEDKLPVSTKIDSIHLSQHGNAIEIRAELENLVPQTTIQVGANVALSRWLGMGSEAVDTTRLTPSSNGGGTGSAPVVGAGEPRPDAAESDEWSLAINPFIKLNDPEGAE